MLTLHRFTQVESAETPKTPKGRAHKREQYTRRFINVSTAPGGKRKVRHDGIRLQDARIYHRTDSTEC